MIDSARPPTIAVLLWQRQALCMGISTKGSAQAGLQPQPQASYREPGQALQSLQTAQEEPVGLFCLLGQLPLPGTRYQRPSKPSNTHGIVECQSSQPVVTDPLQR